MTYDPRARSADCDRCPLNVEIPVPPEIRPGFPILVGEGPGEAEVEEGAPFVGPSGIELMRALGSVGRRRQHVSITNAVLCPMPEFKLNRLDAFVRKENKRRAVAGEPALRHPIDCCKPRLLRDLADASNGEPSVNVVTLGGTALHALGIEASVMDVRGGPREVPLMVYRGDTLASLTARILPTVHPAFVLRARRWTRAFHSDLSRAFRWFNWGLKWTDPEVLYRPDAPRLTDWLQREAGSDFVIYDVETLPGFPDWEHYDPMHDRLRYLGLGSADGKRTVGIPFLYVADNRPVYTKKEGAELAAVLTDFFTSSRWRKAGQNSGYYDRMVIEHFFKVAPSPHVDLIGLHKMAEPELPHRLGYIGSIHTDAPAWKDEFDAKLIRTDEDMKRYNSLDCAITALSIPPVVKAVYERQQQRAASFWPVVQDFCVQLHTNGLPVDQAVRGAWDTRLRTDARHYLKVIRDSLGRKQFNPNSVPQLRDLLFEEWNLLPYGKPTESGDPSTGDDTLRAMLGHGYQLSPSQRNTIRAVRRYRATTKLRGTYVVKVRPIGTPITDADLAFDEDEDSDERETRLDKLAKRPGLVMADGRVHSDYNAHGTVGWRLSSSKPNMQNAPTDIRDMFVAPVGRIFIGCDEAQLELRMIAAVSGAEAYIKAFTDGTDPHLDLCIDFFGEEFTKAGKSAKKTLRRFAKEFTYASGYMASDETKQTVLTSSEGWVCGTCGASLDKYTSRCDQHPTTLHEKRLLYPDLTLRDVAVFSRKWLDRNPEIEAWWQSEVTTFRKQGFIAEPVFGMRRDFLDGEEPNEIVNLRPQSGGSALVHLATRRAIPEIRKIDPSALFVLQGHDSLVFEATRDHERYKGEDAEFGYCPPNCLCRANRISRALEEAMKDDGTKYGLPVPFVGEAGIGYTLQEV